MVENYSNDSPIEQAKHDRFDRFPFAQKIAQVIGTRSDSACLVIGMFGKWGEGKTSVLNLIEGELAAHEALCVRYNPWRHTGEDELLSAFYYELAEALNKKLTSKREDIGTFIDRYIRPAASLAGYEGAAQGAVSILGKASLLELRNRMNDILSKEKTKLVIFIDDIDRLDKSEMSAVFRLVKLNADFNNTVYVLAFDDEAVSHAISDQYGASPQAGRSFLEKIIQVPLRLPNIPQYQLTDFCFEELRKVVTGAGVTIPPEEAQRFSEAFWSGLEPMLKTPRMARLYANILQFSLPLLKGEVNTVDLMLIDGIRIFYPALHAVIHHNAHFFLADTSSYSGREGQESAQLLNELVEKSTPDIAESIRKGLHFLLSELFPGTRTAFKENRAKRTASSEELGNQKRIGTWEYFQRYFSYCVPSIDISDFEVNELLGSAGRLTVDAVTERLGRIAEDTFKVRPLVSKLGRNVEILNGDPVGAINVAEAIARCEKYWTKGTGVLSRHDAPFWRAANLISACLNKVSDSEMRSSSAARIVLEFASLRFGIECLSSMHWTLYGDEDYPKLERDLVQRIGEEAPKGDLFEAYGIQDAIEIVLYWQHREKATATEYLEKLLETSPDLSADLLRWFAVRAPIYSDTDVSEVNEGIYRRLRACIDPEKLLSALKKHFNQTFEPLGADEFPHSGYEDLDERIFAHQLSWHIKHTADSNERESSEDGKGN